MTRKAGLLPPDNGDPKHRVSKFSRNTLRQPVTRGDFLKLTGAMMSTWRAIDAEFEYYESVIDYLALPWYKRLFTPFPARDIELEDGNTVAGEENIVDHGGAVGDVSTATAGDDGPESEDEL
jgi:hypothetical protein